MVGGTIAAEPTQGSAQFDLVFRTPGAGIINTTPNLNDIWRATLQSHSPCASAATCFFPFASRGTAQPQGFGGIVKTHGDIFSALGYRISL